MNDVRCQVPVYFAYLGVTTLSLRLRCFLAFRYGRGLRSMDLFQQLVGKEGVRNGQPQTREVADVLDA